MLQLVNAAVIPALAIIAVGTVIAMAWLIYREPKAEKPLGAPKPRPRRRAPTKIL